MITGSGDPERRSRFLTKGRVSTQRRPLAFSNSGGGVDDSYLDQQLWDGIDGSQ